MGGSAEPGVRQTVLILLARTETLGIAQLRSTKHARKSCRPLAGTARGAAAKAGGAGAGGAGAAGGGAGGGPAAGGVSTWAAGSPWCTQNRRRQPGGGMMILLSDTRRAARERACKVRGLPVFPVRR